MQQSKTIKTTSLHAITAIGIMAMSSFWYSPAWATTATIPANLKNMVIESPVQLKSFELMNHQREPFNRKNLEGKWTFIFFGYTHCPDICPVTLSELNTAADQISAKQNTAKAANDIQYVFVSVDPGRDTIDELAEYISYFNKEFIAITGMKEQLTQLTSQLGVKFKVGDGTSTQYFVSHSSRVLLIDPQARYYARFRAPHYSEEIIDGFNKIRDFYQIQMNPK
ncbi:MAG: SCO family protein [Gammaproteobacteria bacterium]|nr:SCO family protein [Gammaproteobacteria bacterium]